MLSARRPRQIVAIGFVLLASGASCSLFDERSKRRGIDAGFWFETVRYDLQKFGEPITAQEIETVASIARSELANAFAGLPITFSGRRNTTYQVRVVQDLRDLRFRRDVWIAGESRAVPGFGGQDVDFLDVIAAAPSLSRACAKIGWVDPPPSLPPQHHVPVAPTNSISVITCSILTPV
jgi:hypothetical protein